jgi:hypothetical protein
MSAQIAVRIVGGKSVLMVRDRGREVFAAHAATADEPAMSVVHAWAGDMGLACSVKVGAFAEVQIEQALRKLLPWTLRESAGTAEASS